MFSAALICVVLLLYGCASIGPPGGGEVDKTPPEILSISPEPGSTGIHKNETFVVVFSEPITPATLEEALYISPVQKSPKVSVSGRRAVIKLREDIPEEKTLVLTIGSNVLDYRRNRMENSFSAAYSTGDSIDDGRISGFIFGSDKVNGQIVGGWIVSDSLVIDPTENLPDFMTQSGESGDFELSYLPPGKYRLLCWDDKNNDRLYDPAVDRLGLPSRDVSIHETQSQTIGLIPVKRDSAKLSLVLVSTPDRNHVNLRFNKHPEDIEISNDNFKIVDEEFSTLEILGCWIDRSDSTRVVLNTQLQDTLNYALSIKGDSSEYQFTGIARPDTIGPSVLVSSILAGDKDIESRLGGWIQFDDVIVLEDSTEVVNLTGEDSTKYIVKTHVEDSSVLFWRCDSILEPGLDMKLSINTGSISDLTGNACEDSTWDINFSIFDPVESGWITGEVTGSTTENVIVAVNTVKGNKSKLVKTDDDGQFVISGLREGKYILWAFDDSNDNFSLDYGQLNPFEFSERFVVLDDTVEVRNRWETSGVDIKF